MDERTPPPSRDSGIRIRTEYRDVADRFAIKRQKLTFILKQDGPFLRDCQRRRRTRRIILWNRWIQLRTIEKTVPDDKLENSADLIINLALGELVFVPQ